MSPSFLRFICGFVTLLPFYKGDQQYDIPPPFLASLTLKVEIKNFACENVQVQNSRGNKSKDIMSCQIRIIIIILAKLWEQIHIISIDFVAIVGILFYTY